MPHDVEELVAALDPRQREVFELMASWLTKACQGADNLLNDRSDAGHSMLMSLYGQAYSMRVAMCFLLGLDPMECADKEDAIDDFMRQRWEATDWAGWPDAGC